MFKSREYGSEAPSFCNPYYPVYAYPYYIIYNSPSLYACALKGKSLMNLEVFRIQTKISLRGKFSQNAQKTIKNVKNHQKMLLFSP